MNTLLANHIVGKPTYSLIADWTKVAAKQPTQQSLIYYPNSAMAYKEVLIPRLTTARAKIPVNNGVFLAITGDCGLMLKWFLMAAFCGVKSDSNDDDSNASLPKICMSCTSTANCGVSSDKCTSCFRLGPPPAWHEMVQDMGHVDRPHNMP